MFSSNNLVFSSTFLSFSVFSFFLEGGGVISIILGYKGGPPENFLDEEGGHHILQELSFKSHLPPRPPLLTTPLKNERSLNGSFIRELKNHDDDFVDDDRK